MKETHPPLKSMRFLFKVPYCLVCEALDPGKSFEREIYIVGMFHYVATWHFFHNNTPRHNAWGVSQCRAAKESIYCLSLSLCKVRKVHEGWDEKSLCFPMWSPCFPLPPLRMWSAWLSPQRSAGGEGWTLLGATCRSCKRWSTPTNQVHCRQVLNFLRNLCS